MKSQNRIYTGSKFLLLIILGLFLLIGSSISAAAQEEEGRSQRLYGHINSGGSVYYDLSELKEGETLYLLMQGTSGNLDPFIGLLDAETDLDTIRRDFAQEMDAAFDDENPVEAINAVRDKFFLVWDDDSGAGYAAALSFTIPEDGSYYLVASSSITTLWESTYGDYTLYVGIDEPEVLSGRAGNTALIATLNKLASPENMGIEIFTGTLSEIKPSTYYGIPDVKVGDKLYISVERIEGDLEPKILLLDFGGKPMTMVVPESGKDSAALVYTFPEDSSGYSLHIIGCCGDYRMTAGLNAPKVLSGHTEKATGVSVLDSAIPVNVGIRLQQITDIDQKAENFSVVATLKMDWYDPRLSFSPEECNCYKKIYNQNNINDFIHDFGDKWPDFTFYNQQGNRWIQNQEVVILPDGHATYLERFSTTFQAPDFNFKTFPFDTQQFFIRVDSLWSEDIYIFQDNEEFTELGAQLGEEEWYIVGSDVTVSSEEASTGTLTSRYSFGFKSSRHLSFYLIRIFVPILVVIIVSWFSFFLKDYGKRVDVAGGNLLLFITFNFTISNDLPRLGYLTSLDAALISTFVITAFVVVFNVVLKRLEIVEKHKLATRLDTPMLRLYPLLYVLAAVYIMRHFFLVP